MSLVVEDGTGLTNAESYVSIADCNAYAVARGLAFPLTPTDVAEQALRRATAALDGMYQGRFPGFKLMRRPQALQWPRVSAIDRVGYPILANEMPKELIAACCEMAIRELASPGSMAPDLEQGGHYKSRRAGDTEEVFSAGTAGGTTLNTTGSTLNTVENLLCNLLIDGNGGGLFGEAIRN